jgi:hypothetical protein
MPIKFDLEKLRKEHNCINYFETGLYDPRREEASSKKALECNFNKVFCIEIRKDWVELGKKIFKKDIESGKYNLYLDDSVNINKYLKSIDFKNKTIFFLDAHVDNSNIKNFKNRCPLLEELNGIATIERKDNIILIDDLRIIKKLHPWGEKEYGNIDFLHEIKKKIVSINKNYKFSTLNGRIENDVLLAYL